MDESTPTCQRYACKNATDIIVGLVSKRGEAWVVSSCTEHNPIRESHAPAQVKP